MNTRSNVPVTGGRWAGLLFALALVAFVIESQLTQYVQTDLGFRQPYFVFYIVHSAFAIIFPLHFFYLTITSSASPRSIYAGLHLALSEHISSTRFDRPLKFPTWGFIRLSTILAVSVAIPGLLWFIAVTLAPLSDVTALWNTNAFFAYILTVKLFGLEWEARRLVAVVIATIGAAVIAYGGSSSPTEHESPETKAADSGAPLVGDLLTLVASIVYGIYQVLYKMYAALPAQPDTAFEVAIDPAYEPILSQSDDAEAVVPDKPEMVYPPPFGLYANALTSGIGICTLLILWIPIPILHYLGLETFRLPPDMRTVLVLFGISLSGVAFNAGLMILLGLWGPIVTSVGNLLTIVLVFVSDIIFGGAVQSITVWSMLGSGSIILAFGVLAYDMLQKR
ncbi:hypothetical protein PHLGIDRAFT_94162 [Phlebiopsis gigantea 11061_1 CR5-6]|uniref:EamA domain-containing protein n=1 Tax=Phlebiopsis gigantea (strain 11061_1 CR5-6) TaxID=745531 RepID=A0A0C3S2R2_PHLG1|nr:hypothetical protein PHLGIDRAFT_94162 [Phlebiopsis gigantea 11061_1 CR5-6]